MSASMVQGPPGAFANLVAAGFALVIRLVGIFFAVLSWMFFVVSALPYVVLALAVSLLMIPWVQYHDVVIENVEFGMRCRVEPFYRTWPRTLLILLRILYDPLVCWYDVVVWYPFGVTQEVIIPLALEGGLLDALSAFGNFLAIFLYDFLIRYYASLDILTQPFDFQRTSDAWVAFWPLWQNVICHLCQDLCPVIRVIPPFIPTAPWVNPLSFLGADFWGDPQTVCALFNALNAWMRVFQPLFAIILSLLIGQVPQRPDFRSAFEFGCLAAGCIIRAIENYLQLVFDSFVPFPFEFENFLCAVDTALCLFYKLIDNLLRILIHIDQAVLYPSNDFWLRVAKRDMIEWLNLMAPLNFVAPDPNDMINGTPYPFLWPSTQQSVTAPDGTLIINPQFGKLTLAECLSIFFERLICDPTNVSTACFDPGAQEILGPFDPGCLFFQVTVLAADVIAGVSELSYHLFDDRELFIFLDRQLTTTIWKDDLTLLVKCIFDAFAIIPVVGACMSRFFTGIVELILCILDFLIRFVICLVFLAYYITQDIPCFIIEKGRAQVFIRELLDRFADVDNPDSVVNCLCFMLNFGIQVPPIPCSTCVPGGWLDPPPPTRRDGAPLMPRDLDEGHSIMDDVTPVPGLDYWPLHDKRWTQHKQGKKNGHRPQVRSVLEELRVDQGHKRSFYESFRKNSQRFAQHVSIDEMTSYFAQRRKRFERKLDQYLQPWRDQRDRWVVQQRFERLKTHSPNPGHPDHWDKPWLDVLRQGRQLEAAQQHTPIGGGGGNRPFFSVKQDVEAAHIEEVHEDEFGNDDDHSLHWGETSSVGGSLDGRPRPAVEQKPKEVITPTDPPIMGCTPTPPCFDTCDMFRSLILLFDELVTLVTNVIFALVQDWDIAFPYFVTGDVSVCSELCPTVDKMAPDCQVACPGVNISFEEDLRQAIVALADLLRAICNLINLVVPVELTINGVPLIEERPDLCCSVVRLGDLVACILLVIIKGIKSLALEGGQGFPYYTQGLFLMDVDLLFDLTFDVVVCLCNIVRTVFPVQSVADLDLCCIVQNGAMAILELAQWAFQIVISLGTIQSSGEPYFVDPMCRWTDSGCDPNTNNIGFVQQGDIVLDSIFGAEGGACSDSIALSLTGGCVTAHGKDQGQGGVITCVCQLLTTIIPVRPDPSQPTSNENCPIIDSCCLLRRGGFAANNLGKFAIRMLATIWQRWDGTGIILPRGFIAFFFCDETAVPSGSPCGELNVVIRGIFDLVDQCLCEFFSLVDAFFGLVYPGFGCFCDRNEGIFCGVAEFFQIVLIQVIELFRRINDPTYWQPRHGTNTSSTAGVPVATTLRETWAFRFFDPIARSACTLAASFSCFIQILIPVCNTTRANIFESAVVWIFEIVIRIAGFIEGLVLLFAGRGCSGSSTQRNGYGWDTQCLTGALVSLFSLPVDILIADSSVTCGNDPCECYGIGVYVLSDANFAQVTNNKCVLPGVLETLKDTREGYTDCAITDAAPGFPQCRQRCPVVARSDRCVDIPLPQCRDRRGKLIELDGLIVAMLKYFRCMLAVLFPFMQRVNIADGLLIVATVLWQISRAVINFIAAFIVFFFVLFTIGSGIGGCRCHNGTLAIQANGAVCYHCRDPDLFLCCPDTSTSNTICFATLQLFNALTDPIPPPGFICLAGGGVDATPGESDVVVPQAGEFDAGQCCRKSTYSTVPGMEFCERVPRSGSPKVICSGLDLVSAFFDLLSAFVGIFTAFSRVVTADYSDPDVLPTDRRRTPGPAAYERPMTQEQHERHKARRERMSKRYHTLRGRYNRTSDTNLRFAFQRWMRGTRDPHTRSRHHFKKRAQATFMHTRNMYAGLYDHGMAPGEAAGEIPEVLMDAVYGFDTDDCMDDPISCICRNMDVPEVCQWDPEFNEAVSNHTLTTQEVMHAVIRSFDNHTVCDAVIRDVDEVAWIDIPFAIRVEYVDCLEKRIQGERIRDMYPGFPADMFYSYKDGMPELMMNLHRDWNYMYTIDVEKRVDEEERYQKEHVRGTRFEGFEKEEELRYHRNMLKAASARTAAEANAGMFMAKLDRIGYRFEQGYYHHHVGRTMERLERGETIEPAGLLRRTEVLTKHVVRSGSLFFNAMSHATDMPSIWWGATVSTFDTIQDMRTRGVGTVMGEAWQRYKDALAADKEARGPPDIQHVRKQEAIRQAIRSSPFYKWMFQDNSTQAMGRGEEPSTIHKRVLGPFARFRRHLSAVFDEQRRRAFNGTIDRETGERVMEPNVFNMWGARAQWDALKAAFWKRWEARPLTRNQRENRARAWRVMHKIKYMWDPQSVPREVYERFIFGCDCAVVDGSLALLVEVVNYCANNFVPNVPTLKRIANDVDYRRSIFGGTWSQRVHEVANFTLEPGYLGRFVERIGPMVRDTNYTFHHQRHHMRAHARSSAAEYRWEAWPIPESDTDFYYIRPRLVTPQKPRPLHRDLSKIDARQWRRNQNSNGADRFNLFTWFLCLIDDLFDTNFANDLDQGIMDLEDWFDNPSTDPADFPNVGFKYWATFWLRCEFPENLDCSIGVGIEKALEQTLLWFIVIFFLGAFIVPGIMLPLMTFGIFLAFIIVVPAIAWHYSPRCWLMTPSVIQGPVQIPLWPFPIAPPALPFCALADINALLDKWIATCYDFLIPRYMINGDQCPACDQKIDFINCRDVGVSDGLQHLIWLGQRAFGDGFCDWLMYASQTTFFQVWFPGFDDYTEGRCALLQSPSDTQFSRQRWCFWATLPAIFLPITLLVLGATLIGFVLPAVLDLLVAFIYFLAATPLIVTVPGGGSQYFYHPGDQRMPDQYLESADMEALYMAAMQRRQRAQRRQRPIRQRVAHGQGMAPRHRYAY